MGLDMYAYSTRVTVPDVDFESPDGAEEIHYWRKHPNLHGWMENLYLAKGGTADSFNCTTVRLGLADLETLETGLRNARLPHTEGFFFGASDGSETEDDLHFLHKARDAIAGGASVFYTNWWSLARRPLRRPPPLQSFSR
jgi:hypothetical protein